MRKLLLQLAFGDPVTEADTMGMSWHINWLCCNPAALLQEQAAKDSVCKPTRIPLLPLQVRGGGRRGEGRRGDQVRSSRLSQAHNS